MHNDHSTLSPTARNILDQLNLIHAQRLHDAEERIRRNQRASNFSESEGVPSLSRAILAMQDGEMRHKAPLEFEMFAINGDPQRIHVPFAECRDLIKGTASAGGYLVSTETQEAEDILRPWSVTARAGVTLDTGLVGDQLIPKVSAKATPYWLNTESSGLTGSTPTLSEMAATPKTAGALVNFSRKLAKQANAEGFVRRELMRTVGTAVDQAVLNGNGAEGQPLGILNTSGIGTQPGTNLAYTGVLAMKGDVAVANAPDEAIAFLGRPEVRELLEGRERATGSGFIWDNDKVASRAAFASTDVPADTLICGAWPAIWVGFWGDGFTVEINPYDPTGFKSGQIQARILVSCDVIVLHPAAFSVADSIT